MNRREFFKLTGLGAGAAFLLPTLVAAAWTEQWAAEDAVKFAVAHAMEQGAIYADACIGPSELIGHKDKFKPQDLLHTDLLGMRICTPAGWRKLVVRSFDKESIQRYLAHALDPQATLQPKREDWIAAQFAKEKVLALHSSDSTLALDLNAAMMRYGQPLAMPENTAEILFVDILLHQ